MTKIGLVVLDSYRFRFGVTRRDDGPSDRWILDHYGKISRLTKRQRDIIFYLILAGPAHGRIIGNALGIGDFRVQHYFKGGYPEYLFRREGKWDVR